MKIPLSPPLARALKVLAHVNVPHEVAGRGRAWAETQANGDGLAIRIKYGLAGEATIAITVERGRTVVQGNADWYAPNDVPGLADRSASGRTFAEGTERDAAAFARGLIMRWAGRAAGFGLSVERGAA